MQEEGELVISLGKDVLNEDKTPLLLENEIDLQRRIEEYTKNIDELRLGINSEDGKGHKMEEANSYIEGHIEDMLSLCLEHDEKSSQAMRNVYHTLLYSHLTDNKNLRRKVENYFLADEKHLNLLVTNRASENSLQVFASLYYGTEDLKKDQLEEILLKHMDVFDPYLEKGDLRFVIAFLETLATRTSSFNSQKFRTYLEDKMDTITRHISIDDINRSEQIFNLANRLYISGEEVNHNKYFELLSSNLEVILKGFMDGKFSSEIQNMLESKVESDKKVKIVNELLTKFPDGSKEIKREIYKILSVALLVEQPKEVSDLISNFLNNYSDLIIEDILNHGGKIYILDTLMQVCSDEVVDKILLKLDSKLEGSNDAGANAYLFNVLNTSIGESRGSLKRVMPLYEKHIQKLQDVIFNPFLAEQLQRWKVDVYKKAVSNLALYGSAEAIDQAVEMVCHTLQLDPKKFFQQYNLDAIKFVDAWRQGLGDVFENFSSNRIAVERLVAERGPDILKTLSEEFGIRNFSRYPTELLVKQYDERKINNKRFGVILFSTFDHGKAFNSEEDRQVMMSIKDQLGEDILIRFAEANSRFEFVKRLSQLYKRYGQMAFGLVGAHGADTKFQLGFGDERKELSINDLLGTGAEKVGKFFEDKATLILESCSTGADEGIAEQLSRRLGMKVIAPKEDSGGIHKINIKIKEDAILDFDIDFMYTTGRQYEMGRLMHENKAIEND